MFLIFTFLNHHLNHVSKILVFEYETDYIKLKMETETENKPERHTPKQKAKHSIRSQRFKNSEKILGFYLTPQSNQFDLKLRLNNIANLNSKRLFHSGLLYTNILYNNYIAHLLIQLL